MRTKNKGLNAGLKRSDKGLSELWVSWGLIENVLPGAKSSDEVAPGAKTEDVHQLYVPRSE